MKALVFITTSKLLDSDCSKISLVEMLENILPNVPISIPVDSTYYSDYYFWKWIYCTNKGLSVLSSPRFSNYTDKLRYWITILDIRENLLLVDSSEVINSNAINSFIWQFKKSEKLLFTSDLKLVLIPRLLVKTLLEYCSKNSSSLIELLSYLILENSYRTYEIE